MGAAERIRDAGFELAIEDGVLYVEPASRLTAEQRRFIQTHRDEIIAELTDQAANERSTDLEEALRQACRGLTVTPEAVRARMSPEDLAAWEAGRIPQAELRAFARAVDARLHGRPRTVDTDGAPELPETVPQGDSDRTSAGTSAKPIPLDEEGRTGPCVECWTPAGGRILVKARDPANAEWLRWVNPKPTASERL